MLLKQAQELARCHPLSREQSRHERGVVIAIAALGF
jgi:hypothetical protein